jgi:hypothetical protein
MGGVVFFIIGNNISQKDDHFAPLSNEFTHYSIPIGAYFKATT